MADQTFDSVWEAFQSRVSAYNVKQQRQILQMTAQALNEVLAAMPAPRKEGVEDHHVAPNTKRVVGDIESLISDRMQQLGEDLHLFVRYDARSTGFVSPAALRAAIGELGVSLTDQEVDALVSKYDSSGNGELNYHDLYRYLQAQAEVPRSTAQASFNASIYNRNTIDVQQMAKLRQGMPEPLETRLAKGLKMMREHLYAKGVNYHSLFAQMAAGNHKTAPIDTIIPQLTKLGFPESLCSEDEIRTAATRMSQHTPGSFTYNEFLQFFTGVESHPEDIEPNGVLDSAAFTDALVKMSNVNLRKLFKELDSDQDGLISTNELIKGLQDAGGLNAASAEKDQPFREYLESFCKRKAGMFSYAEFLQCVNTRVNNAASNKAAAAQPAVNNVRVPDESTPSGIMELLVKSLRTTHVSVQSVLQQFDHDFDGVLSEDEFFQALSALGFLISQQSNKTFFEALVADTGKDGVDIHEFASLLVNPQKHPKLSIRVRQGPGGASSVPMGSFQTDIPPARPSTAQVRPPHMQRREEFSIADQQRPMTAEEQAAAQPRPPVKYVRQEDHVALTFNDGQTQKNGQQQLPPSTPVKASPATAAASLAVSNQQSTDGDFVIVNDGPTASRGRGRGQPPGGKSSVIFGDDSTQPLPSPSSQRHHPNQGLTMNAESDPGLMSFDPNHPVAAVKSNPHAGKKGSSSIKLTDEVDPNVFATPGRPRPPTAESHVSFNQNDFEVPRSSKRVFPQGSPGATKPREPLSIKDDFPPPSPVPVQPQRRPQDLTAIDLSFDEEALARSSAEPESGRRSGRARGETPNTSTISLAHPATRDDSQLPTYADQHHRTTRKHVDAATSGEPLTIGSNTGRQLLESYKSPPEDIDVGLVQKLASAVYNHSQRLRHTFNEWNAGATNTSILSKSNFMSGAQALGIPMTSAQVEAIYNRFDGDYDGAISYSEFVRLLATK